MTVPWRMYGATFAGFLSVGMLLVGLPGFVKATTGGGDVGVGLVVASYALAAIAARPAGGRLTDRHGARPVLIAGLLLAACGAFLTIAPFGLPGLLLARLVLGVGDGLAMAAGTVWVVSNASADRRGQLLGLYGLAIWGGLASGTAVGAISAHATSPSLMFAQAGVCALVGALMASTLQPTRGSDRSVVRDHGAYRSALPPGLVLGLSAIGFTTVAGFGELHARSRGFAGASLVLPAYCAATIMVRIALGRLPDRVNLRQLASTSALLQGVGLLAIAFAESQHVALLGAITAGAGQSLLYPSLALTVVARCRSVSPATALGVLAACYDIGMVIGAPLAGGISEAGSYAVAFAFAGVASVCGALLARGLSMPTPSAPRDVRRVTGTYAADAGRSP